jgi:tape measure domain-containing protein|nr:MAG TPA: tail tape measure protein [Caudoviricetes sp.]
MATLGLDTSAYEQGINNVQGETKKTVTALSSEYSKAAKSVLELTKQYNESAAKTGKTSAETKELKNQLAAAEAQLKATASALKSANNGMDSFGKSAGSTGSGLTAALTKSQLLASAISTLSTSALSGAKQFVSMGIEYNAQIESYRVGLTNMLGDAQAANEAMAAIQEDAARTPFSVDSLTQANQLLISAGENAGYSRKVIMALGDAVSATGGGNVELSRMAANLQQIANVGKASAIDIKQFAYAGINVYQVLADYTGKTVQEVQNMTISYDVLSQALIAASEEGGRYYNAMDTQSQTMNGRVSTLKDNVSQLAGLMTGDLSSGIGVVISSLNDMTVAAIDAYKTDGWAGLGNAILDLDNPISATIKKFGELGNAAVSALDRASFALNKLLGKNAYSGYENNGEGYAKYVADKTSQSNYDRRRQDAKNGKGIYNESWTERQAKAAAAAGSGGSSITASGGGGTGGGTSKRSTAKAAADTKKLSDTVTETSKQILAGTGNIVGSIQRVVETADNTYNVYDGTTKKLKGTTKETVETITDSWKEVVDGTEKTVKSVTKKVTDADGKVTTTTQKTCDDVVLSVTELQSRIDQNLSNAQKQWSGGIFGRLQSMLTDVKTGNWSGLATNIAKLIWGEISQEQREIISKWAVDSLTAINESYSGGGAKAAYERLRELFTNGIAADATEAKTAVQSFGEILDGLGTSGGVGEKLAGIATRFSSMAGSVISSLGGIVSFITANPILAAILGLTALAGGIGLAVLSKKSKGSDSVTGGSYDSPFSKTPIYDSLAEFSARADSLSRYSTATVSPFSGRQDSTGKQQLSVLQRISNSLDEHLPAIGTGQVVFDTGAVAGALRPALVDGIDTDLGTRAKRKARGG